MQTIGRRGVVKGAVLGALAFKVGEVGVLLTPREAHAQGVPLHVLRPDEAATLAALGDTLVPGARDAGIVEFVDQQLSVPPGEALLTARVVNIQPPYVGFYRAGLAAIERSSQALHGSGFAQLSAEQRRDFVERMRTNAIEGWQGPAGPFLYFVTRSDAVDVAYGTVDGFARLGIPYMPHIPPVKRW